MVLGFVLLYLVVNALLGFSMHESLRHSSLTEPKSGELAMYSLVFLFAGLPTVLVALAFGALRNAVRNYQHHHHHPLHHS
ncbi:hypothetical protein [Terriglobus tenax]|uniref:hypothetical protein n=1 Tax=Terriglobus tenax TaxID=1111115 RepID=UPI0021E0931C|nr:hypothetical protein [Terriglobus tenax]